MTGGTLSVPRILWLNSAILLASSVTLARARRRFLAVSTTRFSSLVEDHRDLGGFFLSDNSSPGGSSPPPGFIWRRIPPAASFYTLTAAHGLHLAAGLFGLLLVAFRKPCRIPPHTAIDLVGHVLALHGRDLDFSFLFLLAFLHGSAAKFCRPCFNRDTNEISSELPRLEITQLQLLISIQSSTRLLTKPSSASTEALPASATNIMGPCNFSLRDIANVFSR